MIRPFPFFDGVALPSSSIWRRRPVERRLVDGEKPKGCALSITRPSSSATRHVFPVRERRRVFRTVHRQAALLEERGR